VSHGLEPPSGKQLWIQGLGFRFGYFGDFGSSDIQLTIVNFEKCVRGPVQWDLGWVPVAVSER